MLLDISPPLSETIAVWPGDAPFRREVLLDGAEAGGLTLSALRTTAHAGAHADAPRHALPGAPAIDEVDLGVFVGPCEVLRVSVPPKGRVSPEVLGVPVRAPRVLFATGTHPNPDRFEEGFAGLAPDLVDELARQGVRLVGIDTPSVDPFADGSLAAHRRCAERGIVILEGLVLAGVPEGRYELIALPLRLVGSEASPVRAVLRR